MGWYLSYDGRIDGLVCLLLAPYCQLPEVAVLVHMLHVGRDRPLDEDALVLGVRVPDPEIFPAALACVADLADGQAAPLGGGREPERDLLVLVPRREPKARRNSTSPPLRSVPSRPRHGVAMRKPAHSRKPRRPRPCPPPHASVESRPIAPEQTEPGGTPCPREP